MKLSGFIAQRGRKNALLKIYTSRKEKSVYIEIEGESDGSTKPCILDF